MQLAAVIHSVLRVTKGSSSKILNASSVGAYALSVLLLLIVKDVPRDCIC